jgi:fructose-bisphosphate aldolase, class II
VGISAACQDQEAPMPVVPMREILTRALADRYGVAAFNILNDLTIEAVVTAAVEERAPVILQTSVKTVRQYGRDQLFGIVQAQVRDAPVPVTLHLDHCPDRSVISDCLAGGWNSVLFDAHELDVAENLRQT